MVEIGAENGRDQRVKVKALDPTLYKDTSSGGVSVVVTGKIDTFILFSVLTHSLTHQSYQTNT